MPERPPSAEDIERFITRTLNAPRAVIWSVCMNAGYRATAQGGNAS